jgi:hypothetical protein
MTRRCALCRQQSPQYLAVQRRAVNELPQIAQEIFMVAILLSFRQKRTVTRPELAARKQTLVPFALIRSARPRGSTTSSLRFALHQLKPKFDKKSVPGV